MQVNGAHMFLHRLTGHAEEFRQRIPRSGDNRFKLLEATMKRHQYQPDALIEVLPTCQGPARPPRYEPITYAKLREWYYSPRA